MVEGESNENVNYSHLRKGTCLCRMVCCATLEHAKERCDGGRRAVAEGTCNLKLKDSTWHGP